MAKKEQHTPEQVVEALNATNGLVYLAADRLRCSARTVYNYIGRYKAVKDAAEHHKGKRLDTAEASLWNAVLKGEAWAVCFYLKTQGKARGYVERTSDLPPLELLLASLPPDIAATVRAALAGAVHGGRNPRGRATA